MKKLADGSTMLGEMVMDNKLIGKVGDYRTVKESLKEKIGEDIKICWLY